MIAVLQVCSVCGAQDALFSQEGYSSIPSAAIGIVMKYFQILVSVAVGLSAGCIPIVAYNIGAGRTDRAKGMLLRLILFEAVVGAVATIIFECIPGPLFKLFGSGNLGTQEQVDTYFEFGKKCLRWYMALTILACINKGVIIYLQAMGRPWLSTIISLTREIVFGVGIVLLLAFAFGLKLDALFYFMAVSDFLTALIALGIVIYIIRYLNSHGAKEEAPRRQGGKAEDKKTLKKVS